MAVPKGTRIGGRKKGTPNKGTENIRILARAHTPEMLKELVRLATKAESEQARVSAIKEVLDRAYGKAPQAIVGDEDGPPVKTVMEIVWAGTSGSSAKES